MPLPTTTARSIGLLLIAVGLLGYAWLWQPRFGGDAQERPERAPKEISGLTQLEQNPGQKLEAESITEGHGTECAHCQIEETVASTSSDLPLTPNTLPQFDALFKRIASDKVYVDKTQFDRLRDRSLGAPVRFDIAGSEFIGTLAVAQGGDPARAFVIDLPEGILTAATDRAGHFQAQLLLRGESRVVLLEAHRDERASASLLASEIEFSQVVCAPPGAVFGADAGFYPSASNKAQQQKDLKQFVSPTEVVVAAALSSKSDASHVLYLDFDGEVVTGDFWNVISGVPVINALPAPRANDLEWITNVWERVSEDMAPFNINVTTDRALYDATPPEDRLIAICTPTDDASPSSGGVAFVNSYSLELSDIVWVFNLSEYSAASTISHEAGHAFGLQHDGVLPADPSAPNYYEGHNGSYAPGWGPIMGAPFGDGFLDEVDQWSIGEYTNANNDENDLSIIAKTANGFGFRPDDFANIFNGGTTAIPVGIMGQTTPNRVGASGIISTTDDRDVFRFVTTNDGAVTVEVFPIDVDSQDFEPGSNTSGANLATRARLLDANGLELAVGTEHDSNLLGSEVVANLPPGTYYLEVEGVARGADPISGFSDYASVGAYTVDAALPTPPLKITGSAPTRDASGKITGPGKLDQPVLLGDTITSQVNGTDFGFSYPSNLIVHHFLLSNTSSADITNLSVSLASGVDFQILSDPAMVIPANSTDTELIIAYNPTASGVDGLDSDTVNITYDTSKAEVFTFAISGIATQSAFKDNYEPNDTTGNSTDLSSLEGVWLTDFKGPAFLYSEPFVFTDARDYYHFNADIGDLVTVDVSYDETQGPLNFELIAVRNGMFVPVGETSSGTGRLEFLIRPDSGLSGEFFVRVSTAFTVVTRRVYDLRWSAIDTASGNDDFYEENDTEFQAFDLTGVFSPRLSEFLGKGVSNDEDWYKIEVPADPFVRMLYVRAEFEHSEGNIDIELIARPSSGPLGVTDGTGTSAEDYEVLTYYNSVDTEDFAASFSPEGNVFIMGVEPGTYFIRVFGDLAGNEYDLVVETLRDDAYEVIDPVNGIENDIRDHPTVLGSAAVGRWLSELDGIATCSAYGLNATAANFVNILDRDFYQVTIPEGALVGQIAFDFVSSAGGTAVFQIFDENGAPVGRSFETVDNVSTFLGFGSITIPNPTGSTFLIEVFPSSEVDYLSAYDFRFSILTEPPVLDVPDDNYEENDNAGEPFDLSANAGFSLAAVDGYAIHLDNDWYKITVPQNAAQLTVEAHFSSAVGDINLALSQNNTPLVIRAEDGTDLERIVVDDPTPGEYFVSISGAETGGQYDLIWNVTLAEDAYEQNDARVEAFDLTGHEKQFLSKLNGPGIQFDEDWYRISVTGERAELRVLADFIHAEGDVDIELYSAAGFLVGRSVSSTDDEAIALRNPAVGDYFIRVYFANRGTVYDLWWGGLTQTEIDGILPDAYEEDDTRESSATNLPNHTFLDELDGLATQTDDDWFSITVGANSKGLLVEASFTHAAGDIDIEVTNGSGRVIARSNSLTDNESITFNGLLPQGTYYIRAYGASLGNPYNLRWVDLREDVFEQNDTFATAFDMTPLRQARLSETNTPTQEDDDWYRFSVAELNSTLTFELTHSDADGSIFYQVYDSSQNLLASDLSTNEAKYLNLALVGTGDFFIRIFGDNEFNEYDLFWNVTPDDIFEENDTRGSAAGITAESGNLLNGVSLDTDWFVLDPAGGATLVELDVLFDHAQGDLNVAVYDQFGNLLTEGTSVDDNEILSFRVNPFDGRYFVEVSAPGLVFGNDYTLMWRTLVVDGFENNDTNATATDLTAFEGGPLSEINGFGTSADEDWYMIRPSNPNLSVYCLFDHLQGNIDIELSGAGGFLARSISMTDNESIVTTVIPGQIYYIRVFGALAGNPYDLSWNSYGGDDAFEENDAFATATSLIGDEYSTVADLVQLDDDWYEIEVSPGDQLLLAEIATTGAIQELTMELYDASEVLLQSVGSRENLARVELAAPAAGSYFLRVTGLGVADDYSLVWSSGSDDAYEENDDFAGAEDLSTQIDTPLSLISGTGAQYDDDWYRIQLSSDGSTLTATLDFVNAEGDLRLTLFDAAGVELVSTDTATDREIVTIDDLLAGDYFLLVTGPGVGTFYDLVWTGYVDDNYEDNNDLVEAYDLGVSSTGSLVPIDGPGVRGNDDDFFVIAPSAVGNVTLTANATFIHSLDGNIDLQILDENGTSLGVANSVTDNESLTVDIDPLAEAFFIRIFGADDSGLTYDLDWAFSPIDNYEDNDSIGTPSDLSAIENTLLSETQGFATQQDADYYRVTLPANSRELTVILNFEHARGNIDLAIYDPLSALIGSAASTTDNEVLTVPVNPAGGDYFIEVTGDNSGNPYDLIWSVSVDDLYEENDDVSTVADISALENIRLSADLGLGQLLDEDWYVFTSPVGAVGVNVLLDGFLDENGNMDLELYDGSDNLLATSSSSNDFESIDIPADPAGQVFKIRVFGVILENSYDLVWSALADDLYEQNDFVEFATDLTREEGVWLDTISGLGEQVDDDWYQIVVSDGAASLTVEALFTHADGDIDLELYRLDPVRDEDKEDPVVDQRAPTLLTRATSTDDDETIVWDVSAQPGIYFIRVYFGNGANNYNLRWDDALVDTVGDTFFLFENWTFGPLSSSHLPPLLASPSANADNDAFPNWAEYALSLDAEIGDATVIRQGVKEISGKQHFTITFIRSSDAVVRGYQFFVEESSDLSFDGDLAVFDSVLPLDDGREMVTFRSSKDMHEAPQCFFRIRVEPPAKGF